MDKDFISKQLKKYKLAYYIYQNLVSIYILLFFIFLIFLICVYRNIYIYNVSGSPHLYDKLLCGLGAVFATVEYGFWGFIIIIIVSVIIEISIIEPDYRKYIYYHKLLNKDHAKEASYQNSENVTDFKYIEAINIFGFDKEDIFTKETLKQRRNGLMHRYHPDNGGDEEMTKTINNAYNYLLNHAK